MLSEWGVRIGREMPWTYDGIATVWWWWWASGVWEVSEFCPTLKAIPGSPLAFHRRWTSELPQVALTHQCASVCVSPTAEVCIESAADSQECVKVCACMCDRVLEAQRVYETMLLVSYGEQCGAVTHTFSLCPADCTYEEHKLVCMHEQCAVHVYLRCKFWIALPFYKVIWLRPIFSDLLQRF